MKLLRGGVIGASMVFLTACAGLPAEKPVKLHNSEIGHADRKKGIVVRPQIVIPIVGKPFEVPRAGRD